MMDREVAASSIPLATMQTIRRNPSIKRLLKLPMWGSGMNQTS